MSLAQVRWIDIPHAVDDRGTLTVFEGDHLPFPIRRLFYMHGVPDGAERGSHAHRHTQQCLVTLAGTLSVTVSDGTSTDNYVLDNPNRALYLPAMIWARLYDFRTTTVALVLCDTVYNPAHVVRDWNEYCRLVQQPALP